MSKRVLIALAASAALLSACASVTSVPAGPYAMGAGRQVVLGREWSDISNIMTARPKKVRLLSIDGPLLNRLYITQGLKPGEFMVKPARREKTTPLVTANMSGTERIEFVTDSVAALDYQRVEAERPRPAKFGSADAVRFDLKAQTSEGLDVSGTALVADVGGLLYVVLYLAPTEHYYEAYLPEVERMMASAA